MFWSPRYFYILPFQYGYTLGVALVLFRFTGPRPLLSRVTFHLPGGMMSPRFFEDHYVSNILAKCLKCMVQKCPEMYGPKMNTWWDTISSFNLLTWNDGFAEPSVSSFVCRVACSTHVDLQTSRFPRNLGWGTHLLDPLIGGPAVHSWRWNMLAYTTVF